ncbi:MAG: hemolysin family protein [Spirochaetaceae bacterium]
MILDFGALVLCLLFSAFFSGTETAFTSLSEAQIQETKNTRGKGGQLVARLTSRPEVLLTTVLVGNNLVNIAGSVMASEITIRLFGSAVLGITTGVLTLIILIFGEVVPKQVAITHNVFWSVHVARVIWILSVVLKPVVWFMSSISRFITGLSRGSEQTGVTHESILYLAKHAETIGMLEAFKFRMVRNVLRFSEVTVNATMTHRTRIFSLDKDISLDEAFTRITETGFSRVPVYDQHPEHIVGVVLLKNLVRRVAAGHKRDALKTIMVEPIFVPENRRMHEMLAQFRRYGLNMAIVLDEYGGVSGLVTVEDVVEEILGEIYDEHEVQEPDKVVPLDDGSYRVSADLPIYVANDALSVRIPQSREAQTIGGYITEQLGRLPTQGESVDTPVGQFFIETMTRKRIVRVRFSPIPGDDEPEDSDSDTLPPSD